ncbi:MAG: ATP-binding protein [Chitinophagales bacterium]
MINTIEALENFGSIEISDDAIHKISYEKCLETAVNSLKSEGKNLRIEAENKLPEWPGYSTLITELFRELLSNAIKFNNNEVAEVKISSDISDDVLKIVLKDNGIGFNQKYADRIFQMFEKLEDRNKYPGPGLGLSTCKKIVEIHRGTISIESTEGSGSTFIIKLPNQSVFQE